MASLVFEHRQENNSAYMTTSPLDPEEFRRQGHMVIDFIADYYKTIEKYPVLTQVQPGYLKKRLPESAPYDPEPIETILQDVQDHIIPGLTHWQSPNHFAYFPATISTAGFLSEMLTTGFNVVGFNWIASPAATELETIVMDWLGDMLKLPNSFLFSGNGGGVLQGTTCEAIVCTMAAARDQMLSQIGRENIGKLVVYGSDQTHSTLQKASQIVGIHPKNFRAIETTKSTSFALSPEVLKSTVCSDIEAGLVPLFLCATIGTTAVTDVDPLGPLCDVAKEHGMWVHVDAAYAGSAFVLSFDLLSMALRNPRALVSSLSTNPEFLRNKATDLKQVVDYKDWQIALSRRFRAIKLWLALRSYGVNNLRNFIRSDVKLAKLFEGLVGMDKRFEVVAPRKFSLVCFRVSPSAISKANPSPSDHDELLNGGKCVVNEVNCKLLEAINGSGRVHMSHAVVGGMYVLRCGIGASLTEEKHIAMAWKVVQEHADAILATTD
ncbi:unnamed protein product [Prunus armeniaca]|uniref:Tyrosine decarboxylase n=1 Tax=Prunus armeniaca TaxID=36596 RepID=A0A6J5UMU4_PRUAR|nr:unnamed protein product [Prunus armeniaca]